MVVAIIGIGLIGASIAKDLRCTNFSSRIIGVDNNIEYLHYALKEGIIDEYLELELAILCSDLILIATPVNVTLNILPNILNKLHKQAVVIDVSSVKNKIAEEVITHKNRAQFVSIHPMAGKESSGPKSAQIGLFKGKKAILCDSNLSSEYSITVAYSLLNILKMDVVMMESKVHDLQVAFVSHLPNILSYSLALTILNEQNKNRDILSIAGTGFESTVRLAASSADMWLPILNQNSESIISALDLFIKEIEIFKDCIYNKKSESLTEMISASNSIFNKD